MLHRIPAPRPWTSRFAWLHPKAYLILHVVLGLLAAATCAWLFYQLADSIITHGSVPRLDHRVSHWMETHNTESGENVALAISYLGNQVVYATAGLVGII